MNFGLIENFLTIVQTGFSVRTREEMKSFNSLIGVPLVANLIDLQKLKDKGCTKEEIVEAWNERTKSFATWIIETCRFSEELSESERTLDIEIFVDDGGYVKLTPNNFLAAVVARYFEFDYGARLLDVALTAANKYLEPLYRKPEKEAKE